MDRVDRVSEADMAGRLEGDGAEIGHAADTGLTARAAAESLGVSPRTIRRAIERGDLPATKFAGVFRINPIDLARYRHMLTTAAPRPHATAPVLRVVPPATPPLPSLPIPLTSFVGRTALIASVADSLRRPDVRLVTLTGPGGVGKTRLALTVAEHLRPNPLLGSGQTFAGGVGFVPLAAVQDSHRVIPTIAQHLGLRDSDRATMSRRVYAFLGERHALLVLDNLEQVIAAGPALTTLLGACQRLSLLITSRAPLRVSGEHIVPVPPLALPPPGAGAEVIDAEAVQLFLDRARDVRPDAATMEAANPAIAELCRRLDGLPLAIELAAARTNLLAPPAMLRRLDQRLPFLTGGARDQPVRLQTMRNAITWSYDLLNEDEQTFFRRLAIFSGGFTLDAAEAVCRGQSLSPDVLDGLASLVDKSLLQQAPGSDDEPRFTMLETVREYGLEQLEASGEGIAVRAAHAAYFLALAERAGRASVGTASGSWHDLLAPEVDNVRAARSWFDGQGATEAALRLTTAASPLWRNVGDADGARRALTTYLAHADEVAPAVRGRALLESALFEATGGDPPRGLVLAEEALAIARALGDAPDEARALATLGMISFFLGRADDGFRHTEEAIDRYRAIADRHSLGESLCQLAMGGNLGAFDGPGGPAALARTTAATEEALALFQALDEPAAIARAHCGLGYLAYKRQDFGRAVAELRASIELFWALHALWSLAAPFEHLAAVAAPAGEVESAARLHGVIDALRETIGRPVPPAFRTERGQERAACQSALGADAFAAALAAGRALPLEKAVAEALSTAATIEAAAGDGRQGAAHDVAAAAGPRGSSGRPGGPAPRLTRREVDILGLLAAGLTNQAIANALFVSESTVKWHLTNIFAKLGVASRGAATVYALRHDMIPANPSLDASPSSA